jgi:hypothetical protein
VVPKRKGLQIGVKADQPGERALRQEEERLTCSTANVQHERVRTDSCLVQAPPVELRHAFLPPILIEVVGNIGAKGGELAFFINKLSRPKLSTSIDGHSAAISKRQEVRLGALEEPIRPFENRIGEASARTNEIGNGIVPDWHALSATRAGSVPDAETKRQPTLWTTALCVPGLRLGHAERDSHFSQHCTLARRLQSVGATEALDTGLSQSRLLLRSRT